MQLESPIIAFTLLVAVILTVPPLFERLRLPGLVGLLVAGIVLGPGGLKWLNSDTETIELLSEVGKIYLMFVAGLEIDLEDFRRKKERSLGFGFSTFAVPMIAGTTLGRLFGFDWNASVLIGSLLASHTLLGYPIIQRLGLVRNEAVSITIGATIFTDILALLVLAICTSIHQGEFTTLSLVGQLVSLGLYSFLILWGLDRSGKEFFRRTGDEEGNQFLFVLLAVFLAAVGAQLIEIEGIVGAFLAGLAVNDVVGNSPVKEKVIFIGSTLFIPCFFIDMGMLLNISTFIETITTSLPFTLAIVSALIGSKFIAAIIIKYIFNYSWDEGMVMWSLSMPQVAATLAATLVGFEVGLLNETVLNSVIVMMLITSILGPLITEKYGRKLRRTPFLEDETEEKNQAIWWEQQNDIIEQNTAQNVPFTVVTPVINPQTQRNLIEMAALLARHEGGQIVPLAIARSHYHMDDPQLKENITQSQDLLASAAVVYQEFSAKAEPTLRIDDDIAQGITRTAREKNASLIIMGWAQANVLKARLFGTVIDSVLWSAHCPVAVMRLLKEPINIQRVLVPVKDLSPKTLRTVKFALLFADTNKAEVKLLHVCDRRTPPADIFQFENDLSRITSQSPFRVPLQIKTIAQTDPARVIIREAKSVDLVVLRSIRRRTVGGLTISDTTTRILKSLSCSLVLFGEPHS